MLYALCFVIGGLTGVALTIVVAAVAVSDPFPPSRTELSDYLYRRHGC